MAKKNKFSYKNLKVNEEELSITKIGEMPNSEKSPIFLLIIFGIFIVFIFFLPDVVNYITNRNVTSTTSSAPEESTDNNLDVDEVEVEYYDISDTLSFTLDETLQLSKFKLSSNTLSFTVTNNGETRYYFSKKNYFIELYTEDKTLLERVIASTDSVAAGISKEFSYTIKSSTATSAKKITIVEKQVDDYPNISLEADDDFNASLICTNDNETITYKFNNDKLVSISDFYSYQKTKTELDYETNYALWQNRVSTYNNIAGISSTFMETTNGFNVNTLLSLENVKISSVDNENYYEYQTEPKVVNFEMEARGFSCN
jgi:hypothetical protein